MRSAHIVPLSKQAIVVLEEILPLTGDGKRDGPSHQDHELSCKMVYNSSTKKK